MKEATLPANDLEPAVDNVANCGGKARSRFADAYSQIRAAILNGELTPGSRLRFDDLRRQYEAGLSPTREALMKLAAEGLVVLAEMKGFRVAPVSRNDLMDITDMRKELEGLALRLSIKRGDDAWEASVVSTHHQLLKRSKIGANGLLDPEWEQRHRAFHEALVSACESPWLLRFRNTLYDQSDRYRKLYIHYLQTPRDDVVEHNRLVAAVLARNTELAVALLRDHFDGTMRILLAAEADMFNDSE